MATARRQGEPALANGNGQQDKQVEKPVSDKDLFEAMKNVSEEELQELTSTYFNFKTTGTYHFTVLGLTTAYLDGKTVDAVSLKDEDENLLLNANTVLVNSVRKITTLPCYIRVQYLGDIAAERPNGEKFTYKNLKVLSFPTKKSVG